MIECRIRSGLAAACLAASALALPAALSAQEDAAGRVEEEIVVSEVLLDALVTDKRGQVVLGLGEGDFLVEEDGEEVELTGVTFYSSRRFLEEAAAARRLGIDPEAVPVARTFVFFFHDQRRGSLRLARQQLKAARDLGRWIEGGLQPDDRVAVVSYDLRLELHQDFTSDREAIRHAVERAASGARSNKDWPSRREPIEPPSLAAELPTGKALRKASRTIYEALELVAGAARQVPGRKNLILFSAGFGELTIAGTFEPDGFFYPKMMRALNDANVAVYTVDWTPPEFDHPLAGTLSRLANDTNGRYFFNFISFATPLERISAENGGYYLLSYRSEHPADGKRRYQRVKVSLRNPEFRVRARHGYQYGG